MSVYSDQFKTVEEINAEIKRQNELFIAVMGRQTEVYSRIVGYYRNVNKWNAGKREEFNERLVFTKFDKPSG